MDQFLKNYKLPKFTQKDIGNLNNHIAMKEIKCVVYNFLKIISSGPGGFTGKFYDM